MPSTTTETWALIRMVPYYRYIWTRRYHILDPLTNSASGSKSRKILWNAALEESLTEPKCMLYSDTLLIYLDWNILFMIHTDASDKHLSYFIIQINKPIAFFSIKLVNPQYNYTTTNKECIKIVEWLKQFRGIIFGYEIKLLSDHKIMVYAISLSESQRVMWCRLIIE